MKLVDQFIGDAQSHTEWPCLYCKQVVEKRLRSPLEWKCTHPFAFGDYRVDEACKYGDYARCPLKEWR